MDDAILAQGTKCVIVHSWISTGKRWMPYGIDSTDTIPGYHGAVPRIEHVITSKKIPIY